MRDDKLTALAFIPLAENQREISYIINTGVLLRGDQTKHFFKKFKNHEQDIELSQMLMRELHNLLIDTYKKKDIATQDYPDLYDCSKFAAMFKPIGQTVDQLPKDNPHQTLMLQVPCANERSFLGAEACQLSIHEFAEIMMGAINACKRKPHFSPSTLTKQPILKRISELRFGLYN